MTLASIGDAVITTDKQGRVTFLNAEAERLSGWTTEAASGRPLPEVFHIINETTRQPVENPVTQVLASGHVVGLANHTVLIARDGQEHCIDDSAAPIKRPGGKIIGVVLVFRDCTEQKKAEQTLQQQEQLLRETGELAKVGGWDLDPATGKGNLTEEVMRIHDLDPATPMTKDEGLKYFHGESRKQIEAAVKAVIEHGTPYDLELEFISAKGVHKWVRTIGRADIKDGKIVRVHGSFQDITVRRQAESAVQHERNLLRTLIDQLPDFIFVKDTQSRFLVVNESLAHSYGKTTTDILGHTDADFLPAELAARFRATEIQVMAGEEYSAWEDTIHFPDGRTRTVVTNMVAFHDGQGKVCGLVGIGRDITARKQAELALRQNEEELHTSRENLETLIEAIPDVIFLKDGQGRWLVVNEGAKTLFRLHERPWKGRTDAEMAGDLPELKAVHEACITSDEQAWVLREHSTGFETVAGGDGQVLEFEVHKVPLFFPDGWRKGLVIIGRNVTLKKQQERALRLSEIMASRSRDIILRIRKADGRILDANAAACLNYGYTRPELLAMFIFDLRLPAEREAVQRQLAEASELGAIFETEHRRKDGSRFPVEVSSQPVVVDDETSLVSVIRDITWRKQAEEKLAREQARFKLIFDTVPIGIAFNTVHPDGSFTRTINDAHLRICGLTRGQDNDTKIYTKITHAEDRLLQDFWNEKVRVGLVNQFSMEKRFQHSDGKIVWVSFSYQRETHPDGTHDELITVADITEHKQLENQLRQSQKIEALGRLAGGVAHDFSNIITVIKGYCSMLLLDLDKPADAKHHIQEIQHATHRATDLTQQLLTFARHEPMRPRELNLNEAVADTVKMLHRLLDKNISLEVKYSPETLAMKADAGALDQILINLTINARDAMAKGGKLVIETGLADLTPADAANFSGARAGAFVSVSVSDTGGGIAPEILPHIFEPFFTTKKPDRGTGLGLASVQNIVRQHHGWIKVENQTGQGTVFRVYFPRLLQFQPAAKPALPDLPPPTTGGHETILCAEDDSALLAVIRQTLTTNGYQIITAETGVQALALWQERAGEIQLLVTDLTHISQINFTSRS